MTLSVPYLQPRTIQVWLLTAEMPQKSLNVQAINLKLTAEIRTNLTILPPN